ncbi:MAG: hypothetical protein HFI08_02605 [Bacilli bacterium]|jgi:hypothetical protein|nr:hypothetical protein [Bacilli bacterium]
MLDLLNKITLLGELGDIDVSIGAEEGFCANSANIWQTVGYILMVFKIVIPILLIIFGMIDLGKAVIASKDDEIKKATKSLMFRAISAVIIFFIPTLVGVIMGIVGNFSSVRDDFNVCKACISDPTDDRCANPASDAWSK